MNSPAFSFYTADFLIGVCDLTNEETGIYIKLLCLQHQKGHLSQKQIGLFLGFVWDSLSDELKSKFMVDEDGRIFNERLEHEINKKTNFIERQSINGKKGGRPKSQTKPKNNPNKTQIQTQTKPFLENEKEIEIENIEDIIEKGVTGEKGEKGEVVDVEVIDELDFENVWAIYGKKGNKKTSRRKWDNLPQKTKLTALGHIPRYVAATPDLIYRKNFETYINQEVWNDKIVQRNGNQTINEKSGTVGLGNPEIRQNTFRTDAERRRCEREMLGKVCEAILQQPET